MLGLTRKHLALLSLGVISACGVFEPEHRVDGTYQLESIGGDTALPATLNGGSVRIFSQTVELHRDRTARVTEVRQILAATPQQPPETLMFDGYWYLTGDRVAVVTPREAMEYVREEGGNVLRRERQTYFGPHRGAWYVYRLRRTD